LPRGVPGSSSRTSGWNRPASETSTRSIAPGPPACGSLSAPRGTARRPRRRFRGRRGSETDLERSADCSRRRARGTRSFVGTAGPDEDRLGEIETDSDGLGIRGAVPSGGSSRSSSWAVRR
jgi:hypothetical protein